MSAGVCANYIELFSNMFNAVTDDAVKNSYAVEIGIDEQFCANTVKGYTKRSRRS